MSARHDEAPKAESGEVNKDDKSFIQLDDDKKGAASAAPAPRSRAIAGVLAAACVVLIVVSLGFVHTGAGEAWSLSWITESLGFSSSSVASTHSGESSSSTGASVSKDSDEPKKDEKKSEDKKDSKEEKDAKEEKKSSDDKGDGSQESKGADNAATAQSGSGSQAVAGGGSSNGGGSGNAGTSNGGQSANSGGDSQDDGIITIKVSVTSSAVGNPVSASGTYSFQEGATVFDALNALGISINAHGSQYGTYVAAIGGLAEKEHGGQSGWMYSVNGTTPMTACSNYVLSDGDNVVWYYVTG